MSTPSEEVRKATERKRGKYITIAAALITAATPGVYGAWESAKQASRATQEEVVRDRQERDLQKNVTALQAAVEALQKSTVTHKDLVELVIKLQHEPPASVGRRPAAPAPPSEREKSLQRELAELKEKAAAAAPVARKADALAKRAPAMRPAKKVRAQVQQQLLDAL